MATPSMATVNPEPNLPDPIAFSDLRDNEAGERRSLQERQLTLQMLPNKRPRTPEEDAELREITQKLATDDIVDPLFRAVRQQIAPDVANHKAGLFITQQLSEEIHLIISALNS